MSATLINIAQMLVDVTEDCFHYWRSAPDNVNRYIVWAEDSEENSFFADGEREQGIHGTIDLFTKTEFDPAADSIQEGLQELESVSWRLNSVQYEEETGFIHHEWEFTAYG